MGFSPFAIVVDDNEQWKRIAHPVETNEANERLSVFSNFVWSRERRTVTSYFLFGGTAGANEDT